MKKLLLACTITALTALTGCGSANTASSADILTGTTWQLSFINGKAADNTNFKGGVPTASFSKDHKVSGTGGCNGYGGSYNLNTEGGINISEVMSTKMFCEGVSENEYMEALQKANMTKIEKDRLTLLNGVEEVLVFVPKQ